VLLLLLLLFERLGGQVVLLSVVGGVPWVGRGAGGVVVVAGAAEEVTEWVGV